ncbi:outer membrane protein assembly factor BamB family protein [Calycomorphotria hydatis]|uniref:Outer membrane protein assembly factor BamB n=1 Tax=Calycomorphotria hydatis TaxID=2528027 RepID=A0A517T919_9PLAN|nr:PQQ-binding-like beta-propeller repeat protein [Calycomorphotria hydatis]QDT64848.1 Outer membrane protein assembly factor BamB precursor [Calycomorphotria hydatis]
MFLKTVRLTLAALLPLMICGSLQAEDWAYWRGPEMNGVSREKGLVAKWSLETGENVLWTSEIGGRAAPVVLNGRVYLNCRNDVDVNGPDKDMSGQLVVCFDAETGNVVWKDEFPVAKTDIPAPRVGWASPVGDTETGNVYVHTVDGFLICYSKDGERLWEYSLYEDFGKISGYGGRTVTPIIDENRIIVSYLQMNWGKTASPPPKQAFYAFDKNDGKLLWVSSPGGAPLDTIYTNPVIAVIEGERQLISGNADGGVTSINARTGKPLWNFRMSRRGLNASPVVMGKNVYISHGEDNIDTVSFGRVQCIDATGRGDVTDTHGVWRIDGIKAGYASPTIFDGILYVVSDIGGLHAIDAETGKQLWEERIGTVGKGSPVYADGKLYVMEVNGRIWTLKPSREGCEVLNEVSLLATKGQKGTDEIYASPAIANDRIYFVTRDRTICVGDKTADVQADPIPEMEKEADPGDAVAMVQLVPYEVSVSAGESVSYELLSYDANGHLISTEKDIKAEQLQLTGLDGAKVEGGTVTTNADAKLPQAGTVKIEVNGLVSEARIRSFPPLPWKYDFEGLSGKAVPEGWVNAFLKLQPVQMDGNTVMKSSPGPGKPSFDTWIGPASMSGYTIQADVMVQGRRRLSSVGLTNERYSLILKANALKLGVQTWQAHLRLDSDMRFKSDPDVWYTMKLSVQKDGDKNRVLGKVWPREEAEPEDWTIEVTDPNPNPSGSPGLFVYRLSDCYFDNVIISEE